MLRIYSKPGCSKCMMLERILNLKKIEHECIDVSVDDESLNKLVELNLISLPVIEEDGIFNGNYSEIIQKFK